MLKGKIQYVIKSVPSDNTKALENLLNEMSQSGWDLYSMHEVEVDEGFQYNCIFISENIAENSSVEDEDVVNITTFKSQMEKMLSSQLSPYETCKEIQGKIKEQRLKIAKIKSQLESSSDTPSAKTRNHLNDEISKGLRELDGLRQSLIKTISPDLMYSKIGQNKLSITLSEELVDLVNPDMEPSLIAESVKVRQKLTDELGYVLPKIMFEDDDKLNPFEFSIRVRGLDALNSYAYPKFLMFFEDELQLDKKITGAIYSLDAITGKKIVWIDSKKTKAFWQNGLTPEEFIGRALEFVARKHVDDLLDYADINNYIEIVSEDNMFLVENVVPEFLSIAELRYLLVNLLKEGVSIKDIVYIFEKINDFSDEVSKEDLLDKVRLSLARFISKKAANGDGVIQAFEFSEKTFENLFSKVDSNDNIVRVDGGKIEKLVARILKKAKTYELDLGNIIIIAPLEVRHMTYMILSQFVYNVKVLAREEITNDYSVEIIDEI